MKKSVWNMIKILLVTIMIVMLPGTNNPVYADDMTAEAKFTVVQESSGGSSSETKPVYNIPKTGIE